MRISDWSSDVCSSDLIVFAGIAKTAYGKAPVIITHLRFSHLSVRSRILALYIQHIVIRGKLKVYLRGTAQVGYSRYGHRSGRYTIVDSGSYFGFMAGRGP